MFQLTEGEKDPRPFMPADFVLPSYERSDVVTGRVQLCCFSKPTGQSIGSREILQVVYLAREHGEWWLDVQAGIDAGGLWFEMKRLGKTHEEELAHCLGQLPRRVATLGGKEFFDVLIRKMRREYQEGLKMTRKLVPNFLKRFPEYGYVVDRFGSEKVVMFVGGDLCPRAILWGFAFGRFEISVGEIMEVSPGERVDIYAYELKGRRYWPHDWVAVWYPTEERDTAFNVNDMHRSDRLLQEGFDVLANYLQVDK